jgi:hypothetical protein
MGWYEWQKKKTFLSLESSFTDRILGPLSFPQKQVSYDTEVIFQRSLCLGRDWGGHDED